MHGRGVLSQRSNNNNNNEVAKEKEREGFIKELHRVHVRIHTLLRIAEEMRTQYDDIELVLLRERITILKNLISGKLPPPSPVDDDSSTSSSSSDDDVPLVKGFHERFKVGG